jgi:hypothetical protein
MHHDQPPADAAATPCRPCDGRQVAPQASYSNPEARMSATVVLADPRVSAGHSPGGGVRQRALAHHIPSDLDPRGQFREGLSPINETAASDAGANRKP